MYINTASKQKMEKSLLEVLNIEMDELDSLFETCYHKFQKDHAIFILDDQYDFFMEYVKKHLNVCIDNVSFYHLSRRLNGTLDYNGYGIHDVLSKDTSLSKFLKKYGIDDNCFHDDNVSLKQILSNDSFKGFAFRDVLERNEIYEVAEYGPELFEYLFAYTDSDKLLEDFKLNSKFYLLEYLVPIEQIYFENYDELSNIEKQYHIVVKAMQRLYAYRYDSVQYDEDNPVLGMKDGLVLDSRYLISKEKL